jgi:hypothetical protein
MPQPNEDTNRQPQRPLNASDGSPLGSVSFQWNLSANGSPLRQIRLNICELFQILDNLCSDHIRIARWRLTTWRCARAGSPPRVRFVFGKAKRSSFLQDLCNADVFQPSRVGQNSQSFLLHILTGVVVGETKKQRLTPLCI